MWADGGRGEQLAEMLRSRARSLGVEIHVEVTLWEPGNYGVSVDWAKDHVGVLFEVADSIDGVRVLDPDGEDVTVDEALDYFAARLTGSTAREALNSIAPQRAPWWRRRRNG